MRRILTWFFIVILVLAGALVALPFLLPTSYVQAELIRQVKLATGRDLSIDGGASFTILSGLGVTSRNLTLGGGENEDADVALDELSVSLAIMPLLSGIVEIESMRLVQPVITLKAGVEGARAEAASQTVTPTGEPVDLSRFGVKRITVTDGRVVTSDNNEEKFELLRNVDVTVTAPRLNQPVSLVGTAQYEALPISFSAELDNPNEIAQNKPADLIVTIGTQGSSIALRGTALQEGTPFAGMLSIASDDPNRIISNVLGRGIPGLGKPIDFSGEISVFDDAAQIAKVSGIFLGEKLTGATFVDLSSEKPTIQGAYALQKLALDEFFQQRENTPEAADTRVTPQSPVSNPTPIDLSVLEAFNGSLEIVIAELSGQGINVENFRATAQNTDGVLEMRLDPLNVAGGTLEAVSQVGLQGGVPASSSRAVLEAFDLTAISALIGQDLPASGLLSGDIAALTNGQTVDDWIANLAPSGSVSLSNGRVTGLGLSNALNNPAANEATDVAVTLNFDGFSGPVSADLAFAFLGERFEGRVSANPDTLLEGSTTDVTLSLAGRPVSSEFTGKVSLQGSLAGTMKASSASANGLLTFLGQSPLPEDGNFAFNGEISASAEAFNLSDFSLQYGNNSGQGSANITLGSVPDIIASMNFDTLDLTPFMGTQTSGNQQDTSQGNSTGGQAGWSTEPISVSALKAFSLQLDASANRLIARDIKAGPVKLSANVENGLFSADLSEFGFYGGGGSGSIRLSDTGNGVGLATRFNLSDLDVRPFLTDAAKMSAIDGLGAINFDLQASGQSQYALMQTMTGRAQFDFRDGAIYGINIPAMIRSLSANILTGWLTPGESQKTDFAEFSGSFDILNGEATNTDLRLYGPLVRVTGGGTVSLPPKTLNYKVNPSLVASLAGQGGADIAGLAVPIIISGPWNNPNIYPDIAGILTNPEAAFKQLQGIGGLVPGPAGDALERILGGAGAVVQAPVDIIKDGPANAASQLLEKILPGNADTEEPATGQPLDLSNPQGQQQQNQGSENAVEDAARSIIQGIFD